MRFRTNHIPLKSEGEALVSVEGLQRDVAGFVTLSQVLHRMTGIHLPMNPKNLALMAGRLAGVLRKRGLINYSEYFAILGGRDTHARHEFVRALTTNTTSFFREPEHFSFLSRVLPLILDRKRRNRNRELRIWCAAGSTGQEAYSILMTLGEALSSPSLRSESWGIKFLATDIDDTALRYAGRGTYSDIEMLGVPQSLREKYWLHDPVNNRWKASAELRDKLKLATFNLVTETYPFRFRFDFIFCRNVFIYFNRHQVPPIVERVGSVLQPGGFLFLGHAEAGLVQSPAFRIAAPAVYERVATASEKRNE